MTTPWWSFAFRFSSVQAGYVEEEMVESGFFHIFAARK